MEGSAVTETKGSGPRAACGALVAAIGLALSAPVCGAGTAASREPIEPGLFDDATGVAIDGGQRRWGRQPGSSGFDAARSVATDTDGNVYLAGQTEGALGGPFKGGNSDALVIKYDRDGNRRWSRQPGTSFSDFANGIATDLDGNVYVVGGTDGALGGPNEGAFDALVIKYDRDGRQLWARQPGSACGDGALGVATDAEGNVYVVGVTCGALGGRKQGDQEDTDAFLIKYDRDGDWLWARQPGTSGFDAAWSVATDADGSVYVAGRTEGALADPGKGDGDAFLIKYDGNGHRLWALQPGTSGYDLAYGVATDGHGDVYVVGEAGGALAGPDKQGAFVIKYNADGYQLWARQPATNEGSIAFAVSADANGNVFIAGSTIEGLGGRYKGSEDAFVIKYDLDGHVLWSRQFGKNVNVGGDFPQGVATDIEGNVYVAGLTWGALVGPARGGGDAFLIKFAARGSAAQAVPDM